MEVSFDFSKLKGEISGKSAKYIRDFEEIYGGKILKELLESSCPHIEQLLQSGTMLPPRDGLKQFYDTESKAAWDSKLKRSGYQARKQMGGNHPSTSKFNEPHLIQMFKVVGVPGRGGHGVIVVSNDKYVPGRNRNYNLFKLLWEGTESYVAPVKLELAEYEALKSKPEDVLQYKNRMQKELITISTPYMSRRRTIVTAEEINKRRREKYDSTYHGGYTGLKVTTYGKKKRVVTWDVETNMREDVNWDAAKRMTYYNRFQGRFYYNQFQRRGIGDRVVEDFHQYIADCIASGLNHGMGEIFRKGLSTGFTEKVKRTRIK